MYAYLWFERFSMSIKMYTRLNINVQGKAVMQCFQWKKILIYDIIDVHIKCLKVCPFLKNVPLKEIHGNVEIPVI